MGRATLIIVVGVAIILSFVQLSLNSSSNTSTELVMENYSRTVARNIAHSELNRLTAYLSDNPTYRSETIIENNVFSGTANYTIKDTVIDGEGLIAITSIGQADGQYIQVDAIVNTKAVLSDLIKYYAVACGNHYKMDNVSTLTNSLYPSSKNANVICYSDFNNDGKIAGFADYGNSNKNNGSVIPPDNPESLSAINNVTPSTFPLTNVSDFSSMITDYYSGSLDIGTPFSLGTESNPRVVHVDGTLKFLSSAVISGYGIFIAEEIDCRYGATFNTPDINKINISMFSFNKIKFDAGTYKNLFIYANTDIEIFNSTFVGQAVAADHDADIKNSHVYYLGANTNILPPTLVIGSSNGRAQVVSVYE